MDTSRLYKESVERGVALMNLKARMRNKTFWVAFMSALVLLAQQMGLKIFPENIMDIVNTILLICSLLGIVIDPTTSGISD